VDNSSFLPLSKFKGANLFFIFISFSMFIPDQTIPTNSNSLYIVTQKANKPVLDLIGEW